MADWQSILKRLNIALVRLDELAVELGEEIPEGRLLSHLKIAFEHLDLATGVGEWEIPDAPDPLKPLKSSKMQPYLDWAARKLRNLVFRISHKLGEDACVKIPRPEKLKMGVEDDPLDFVFIARRIGTIRGELEMVWLVGISE